MEKGAGFGAGKRVSGKRASGMIVAKRNSPSGLPNLAVPAFDHSRLMGLITSPSSWEQVIYDVVAFEGMDPWDIDLVRLSEGFVVYIKNLETMDFKIPAKYLMVAATLLRMKSERLPLMDFFQEEENGIIETNGAAEGDFIEDPGIGPLAIPPARIPQRRIIVSELIEALRKVLGTAERRDIRIVNAREKIRLKEDDLARRITSLYDRITSILSRLKGDEVTFSKVVTSWQKEEVAGTFLPLIYLDHQKKVECRQEEIFQEIYIRKGQQKTIIELPPEDEKRKSLPDKKSHSGRLKSIVSKGLRKTGKNPGLRTPRINKSGKGELRTPRINKSGKGELRTPRINKSGKGVETRRGETAPLRKQQRRGK